LIRPDRVDLLLSLLDVLKPVLQICGLQQIFISDYVQSNEKKTCFQHIKIACSRFYM
ncbi:hypothetical protein ISN45_Aa06g012900, partial [Arabidopsis thaliana x Arabidopsis arenosa]